MAGANPKQHISYSELMNWRLCPLYHKLANIEDLLEMKGSEFTCMGTAAHFAIEETLKKEAQEGASFTFEPRRAMDLFDESFKEELEGFFKQCKELDPSYVPNKKLVYELREAGHNVVTAFHSELHSRFPNYEFIEAEHLLYVPIERKVLGSEYSFKGYVDLVIRHNGKYVLVDWKTCGWGWDKKKQASIKTTYQLTYYKHFFAQEKGVDPDEIQCFFGLLKRSPGKGNPIEFIEVKAGKKKIQNALDLLHEALLNIHAGNFIPNFSGCRHEDRYGDCPFADTKFCSKKLKR